LSFLIKSKKKKKNYFAIISYVIIFLGVAIGLKYFLSNSISKIKKSSLSPVFNSGVVKVGLIKYNVSAARTLGQKEKGLMYVKKMPENAGMLFIFKKEVDYPFWMKNTLIPLTALFINNGKVVSQVNMKPCVTKKCSFYYPFAYYKYALEINLTHKNLIGKKIKIQGGKL
jgi:hypothetical protein